MLSVRAWIADVDWREYRRALAALVPLVFAAATVGWTVGEVTDRPPAQPRPPAAAVAGVGAADPVQQHPDPAAPAPVPDAGWPAGQPRQQVAWQPTQATPPPAGGVQAVVDEAVEHDTADVRPSPGSVPDTTPSPGGSPEPDPEPTAHPGPEPSTDRQQGQDGDGADDDATALDPLPVPR